MNPLSVPGAAETTALDVDELHARCLGRLDLVNKVLGRFRQSLDQELEQLELAVAAADAEGIARLAHRIKGTSLTVAAHDLRDSAERLEATVASQQLDGIDACLIDLRRECARLSELITDQQLG